MATPLALVSSPPAGAVPVLASGFTESLVAAVPQPTEVAFTPDGRMLITSQTGQLRVFENGALEPTPALILPVCSNGERGLLGLAVDPNFESNNFIYLYVTKRNAAECPTSGAGAPVNQVVRYELEDDNDAVDPVVLLDNIPSFGIHNGGDLNFGPDNGECAGGPCLYVAVGDGGCDLDDPVACQNNNTNAQENDTLLGKILRINKTTGEPSAVNSFFNAGERCGDADGVDDAVLCSEIWATGLRNPFQFSFAEDLASLTINDVGTGAFEEINTVLGGNYSSPPNFGFNFREGPCPVTDLTLPCPPYVGPPDLVDPYFSYQHGSLADCEAITGSAIVPSGTWGSHYDGGTLFSDFTCGRIFLVDETDTGPFDAGDAEVLAENLGAGAGISMAFGPAGLTTGLYYTSHANGGEVRRIVQGEVPAVRSIVSTSDGDGLWLADSQGRVYDFGDADHHGDVIPQPGTTVVGMAATNTDDGYWVATTNGRVFARGDADHFGDTSGVTLNLPVVGMAKTPDDGGYWLVAADGGVFTFGNAEFFGSLAKIKLNRPIVGIAATPDGEGYFLVAADGGVFTFGNAEFNGALGKVKLNKPVVGMAATNDGEGYWLVASDGGVFTFGNANFKGATGSMPPSTPAIGMAVTPSDDGYWIAATDGTVIDFEDAVFPF
ncbi:MAG: PQQ-dependent sugar dehydrogenase [Acidimicrobiia bacterium]